MTSPCEVFQGCVRQQNEEINKVAKQEHVLLRHPRSWGGEGVRELFEVLCCTVTPRRLCGHRFLTTRVTRGSQGGRGACSPFHTLGHTRLMDNGFLIPGNDTCEASHDVDKWGSPSYDRGWCATAAVGVACQMPRDATRSSQKPSWCTKPFEILTQIDVAPTPEGTTHLTLTHTWCSPSTRKMFAPRELVVLTTPLAEVDIRGSTVWLDVMNIAVRVRRLTVSSGLPSACRVLWRPASCDS